MKLNILKILTAVTILTSVYAAAIPIEADYARQYKLNTALQTAVKNGDVEEAKKLLIEGADINFQSGYHSMLHLAVWSSQQGIEMFDLILNGIPCQSISGIRDPNNIDRDDAAPAFYHAVRKVDVVRYFLEYSIAHPGCLDLNKGDCFGYTPFNNACEMGAVDTMRLFFDFDEQHPGILNIAARSTAFGQTILYTCCTKSRFQYANKAQSVLATFVLLRDWITEHPGRIDVNAKSHDYRSPEKELDSAFCAAVRTAIGKESDIYLPIVNELLDWNRASPSLFNQDDITSGYLLAINAQHDAVVDLFIRYDNFINQESLNDKQSTYYQSRLSLVDNISHSRGISGLV